jgi:hypothetical protein
LTQTAVGTLVAQDAADIPGEVGQTFTVVIKAADGTVLRTTSGISAETFTYTVADRLADGPHNHDPITVEVFSVVGALESFMPNQLTVTMSGFTWTP